MQKILCKSLKKPSFCFPTKFFEIFENTNITQINLIPSSFAILKKNKKSRTFAWEMGGAHV
jgi:hypothetical protein